MRCERRTVDGQTAFVVTDLDDRERNAAYTLEWYDLEDGMGVTFPPQTRYLDQAYANFQIYAPQLIEQRIDVEAIPWQDALSRTLAAVCPLPIEWYLVGSVALAVRGIKVVPGDIDLVTDAAGARVLESTLRSSLIQPLVATPGWIADSFTRAFMGACVEWAGGVNTAADQPLPGDFGPTAASRLEEVRWGGYTARIPPLDLQLEVNRRRGRTDRVERIERWMRQETV